MQIIVNGTPTEVPNDLTMTCLVERLALGNQRLAIEVNEELVPRSRFDQYRLGPADRVEIIHAVGGG